MIMIMMMMMEIRVIKCSMSTKRINSGWYGFVEVVVSETSFYEDAYHSITLR
jgi:hypothetical protein